MGDSVGEQASTISHPHFWKDESRVIRGMILTFKTHRTLTRIRNPGRVDRKVGAVTAEPGTYFSPSLRVEE